jgi:hypothetical protein
VSVTPIQCDPASRTDQDTPHHGAHAEGEAPTEDIEFCVAVRLNRNPSSTARIRFVCGVEIEPKLWR